MNKLIEKSYAISFSLTIALVVSYFLLSFMNFGQGLQTSNTTQAEWIYRIVWVPLALVAILSYILALIKAIKKSSIVFTVFYAGILIFIFAYGVSIITP